MARWLPLESNPTVMNKLIEEFGVQKGWSFVDVYGLDEDLLAMVPQPVGALILLFPLNEEEEKFRLQQEQGVEAAGQDVSDKIFFLKQYIGNACGTVAVIHAATNVSGINLGNGPLKEFVDKTKDMNPEDRGHALETFVGIADIHDKISQEGQTAAPDRDAKLEPHFIALVNVDGNLFELDGRKKFPINHGSTSQESFLIDSASICRQFMERNPTESRFAIIALATSE